MLDFFPVVDIYTYGYIYDAKFHEDWIKILFLYYF